MFVDSTLQVYTTIVSWRYYGVIWDLLVGSGLIFVPIVFSLFNTLLEARKHGSMSANNGDSLMSAVEIKLVRLFIVMFFVAMPVNFVSLNSGNIETYENIADLTRPSAAPQAGTGSSSCTVSSGSTIDAAVATAADGTAICASNSDVPLWWYAVLRLSHALTQAIASELTSSTNNGFRALAAFTRNGKIRDESLKRQLGQFHADCYDRASVTYSEETSGVAVGPGNNDVGYMGRDVSGYGNEFFMTNYYPEFSTNDAVAGMAYVPERNRDRAAEFGPPQWGKVGCVEFWRDHLEPKVYEEAVSPDAGDDRARWLQRFVASAEGFVGDGTTAREYIVRNYINNSNIKASKTVDNINAEKGRNSGVSGKILEGLGELGQAHEFVAMSITVAMVTDALVKALPILQSYMAMFIVIMLPFGLVLSGYSWDFVIKASVLMFFVIFWSALWAFAAWADDSMARALWPGQGDGVWSGVEGFINGDGWQDAMNRIIHSVVVGVLYLGGPIYGGYVLAAAGFREAGYSGGAVNSGQLVGGGGTQALGSGLDRAGSIGLPSIKGPPSKTIK